MNPGSIISLRDVTFSYRNRPEPVLKSVNLEISPGTITLICGPTGSGKTTLIRLMNGLIPHFHEGTLAGNVLVDGTNTKESTTVNLSQIVGMLFQNPENQLIASTCEREIAFGPENLGLAKDEIRERVERCIDFLSLDDIRDKSPIELSGGQKQKVAIAAVLALQPKVLVFDEPSSNLDPESTNTLVDIIKILNEEMNATIIIVEHRLELFLNIATHIVCMKDGRVIIHGETNNIIETPIFHDLGVQVPVMVRLFKRLKDLKLYSGDIPTDIDSSIKNLYELFEST